MAHSSKFAWVVSLTCDLKGIESKKFYQACSLAPQVSMFPCKTWQNFDTNKCMCHLRYQKEVDQKAVISQMMLGPKGLGMPIDHKTNEITCIN